MGVPGELCSSHADIGTVAGKPPRGSEANGGAEVQPRRLAHPRTRRPRTRPGRWERVRARASPTRHTAHLAPPRPRWTAAASCSSGSACSRIPSSPASPWQAPGPGAAAAAAAIVRGALPCARGPAEAPRRLRGAAGAGCGRAGERVRAGSCGRRLSLSPPLSPPPLPPEIARRARCPGHLAGSARRARPAPPAAAALCGAGANQRGRGEERRAARAGGGVRRARGVPGSPQPHARQAFTCTLSLFFFFGPARPAFRISVFLLA